MTTFSKILSVVALAVGLSLTTTPSASANPEFGHHVQSCVKAMGFDGTHNPGMHTGKAGWDPSHVC